MSPEFFSGVKTSFEFLESVDGHIHVEVRKLYNDAELPEFTTTRENDNKLIMTYRSKRPFADLAAGMSDYISKTIRQDEVKETKERWQNIQHQPK